MHILSNIPVKYFVSRYLYPYELYLTTITTQQQQQKKKKKKKVRMRKESNVKNLTSVNKTCLQLLLKDFIQFTVNYFLVKYVMKQQG